MSSKGYGLKWLLMLGSVVPTLWQTVLQRLDKTSCLTLSHWYLKWMGVLALKTSACPFPWCLLKHIRMNSDFQYGFLDGNDLLLGRDAEINLVLLCLSIELPVSIHLSRRRRNPPFGSCKFFGGWCKIKKRGSVAVSTSDSNLVNSDINVR